MRCVLKLNFQPARKSEDILAAARDCISHMLRTDRVMTEYGEQQLPRLYVWNTCSDTRWEFENVRYPSDKIERPSDERPKTFRKHALDCFCYLYAENPRFVSAKPAQQLEVIL